MDEVKKWYDGYLNNFISMNEAGLKDDVLTVLIHMEYLGFDSKTKEAFIPNEEVRDVFESAIKELCE